MNQFINVADLVNTKTGKTWRQENSELQHNIPLGSLVELETGERLFVIKHNRDCDQTPMYSLGMNHEINREDSMFSKLHHGYSEESLKVVETK